ncbi:hypothetical protein HanXRQr2_Chr09g0402671 [Helianthus annuus]|uniref:Uncharacterized protein n=1 Tax=Helianthus annuus TaxID=4232 RepID=A0A9K3N9P4_HELAN|nr:hypothetical protein HanXRQr2_Chr09g0402671 [Helianthus annuus]KAJ0894376.1 hypothetical protein HanPSC8_Chr09g0388381 [Helianthus annuus]
MLVSDLCHFLCFLIDEYYNGIKRRMTLMSCLKIHIQTKTHFILSFQTATKTQAWLSQTASEHDSKKKETDDGEDLEDELFLFLIFLIFFFCCLLCIFQLRIKKYIILY